MLCLGKMISTKFFKNVNDFNKVIIFSDQYKKIKEFNQNPDIVIRKADKNNCFVVLNRSDYVAKINDILSNRCKFSKASPDSSLKLKKKLRDLIDTHNAKKTKVYLSKPTGHFQPGYIYGNPKIHKNKSDPPLRPIISQKGTCTYETAKQLTSHAA